MISSMTSAGANWALLVAGSAGYGNYRHQADVCHAYHTVVALGGIPASNVIVMAVDDVANSVSNPFPGKLFNKPTKNGTAGKDVFEGCRIDYRGQDVTPANFLNVLAGNASAVAKVGTGRVLASTAADRVFVNFVDHGGVGLIGFPRKTLHAKELVGALEDMHNRGRFKQLVFYLEACESGSMFAHLPAHIEIYAATAANATQSSWGTYCSGLGGGDMVNGTRIGSCLGDLFSVSWMENSDAVFGGGGRESLAAQYELVRREVNRSHVLVFGQRAIALESLAAFQGDSQNPAAATAVAATVAPPTAADAAFREATSLPSPDAELASAFSRYLAGGDGAAAAADELQRGVAARQASERRFARLEATVRAALGLSPHAAAPSGSAEAAAAADLTCHYEAHRAHVALCGEWTAQAMRHSATLARLCQLSGGRAAPIVASLARVCSGGGAAEGGAEESDGAPLPGRVSFADAPFHVMDYGLSAPYLPPTDVHVLNGEVASAGGTVRGHCLNGSVADYELQLGPAWSPEGLNASTFFRHNFTTTLHDARHLPHRLTGVFDCFMEHEQGPGKAECYQIEFVSHKASPAAVGKLSMGANPPPPPPPGPACVNAYTEAACAAMCVPAATHSCPTPPHKLGGSCDWCTSNDGVHALCFSNQYGGKYLPDQTAWTCKQPPDRTAAPSIAVVES